MRLSIPFISLQIKITNLSDYPLLFNEFPLTFDAPVVLINDYCDY